MPRRTYNPEDGRGRTKPISQPEAIEELVQTVCSIYCSLPKSMSKFLLPKCMLATACAQSSTGGQRCPVCHPVGVQHEAGQV